MVDNEGREVAYGFAELDELTHAYAITVHKSQGSEYPAVVVPLTIQHYPMLQRNLVYTGITRGKRLVVLLGHTQALAIAVRGQQILRRLVEVGRSGLPPQRAEAGWTELSAIGRKGERTPSVAGFSGRDAREL